VSKGLGRGEFQCGNNWGTPRCFVKSAQGIEKKKLALRSLARDKGAKQASRHGRRQMSRNVVGSAGLVAQLRGRVLGRRGVFGARETADFEDEVGDDGDVDEEEKGSQKGRVVNELIDFEGDQAGGRNDGEELGPAFAEEEADAFGEEESGIEKGAQAECAEFMRVHVRELFE
jgi:hypothetical protein